MCYWSDGAGDGTSQPRAIRLDPAFLQPSCSQAVHQRFRPVKATRQHSQSTNRVRQTDPHRGIARRDLTIPVPP
jgi:hypothetical protein